MKLDLDIPNLKKYSYFLAGYSAPWIVAATVDQFSSPGPYTFGPVLDVVFPIALIALVIVAVGLWNGWIDFSY